MSEQKNPSATKAAGDTATRRGLLSEGQFILLSLAIYAFIIPLFHWSTWGLALYQYILINLVIFGAGYGGANRIGLWLVNLENKVTGSGSEKAGAVLLVFFLMAVAISSVIALIRMAAIVWWDIMQWLH